MMSPSGTEESCVPAPPFTQARAAPASPALPAPGALRLQFEPRLLERVFSFTLVSLGKQCLGTALTQFQAQV